MPETTVHAVTGAFGYSGRYIAKQLLDKSVKVRTLTNSIHRPNPFEDKISVHPFNFNKPEKLTKSLFGVSVLYNTYWVRFNHETFSHADAVKNTLTLFECAKKAGVERVVHISITNPSKTSPLEYFRGKAQLEDALINSGISYAILRPAVLFGREDILINNIAWTLRYFPLFGVFGKGDYGIQPIYVDDLAYLAVEQGMSRVNTLVNAVGPERFTYKELVQTISQIIQKKRPIISMPPNAGYWISCILGKIMRDVFVTREEIEGLMAGLLAVDTPPVGKIRLTDWVRRHRKTLGRHYSSELARRQDRKNAYEKN